MLRFISLGVVGRLVCVVLGVVGRLVCFVLGVVLGVAALRVIVACVIGSVKRQDMRRRGERRKRREEKG
jgi:hypothetical protein